MKFRTFVGGFALGCACMGFAAMTVIPQDPPQDMEKMYEELMMKYAVPAEEHKELAQRAGDWNWESEFFMAPGMPGEKSKGTAHYEMIMGGRYLLGQYRGEIMEAPFEGAGLTGYDRLNKTYQSMWIDNMGTTIMHMQGTEAKDGEYHYKGKSPDLMQGKMVPNKSIERIIDKDHWEMEMYGPGPDGNMFMTMKLTYTRAE